jgi:hypothetical protein
MWQRAGMLNTFQDVKKCCNILTTFDLLSDEGPSKNPSRHISINDYKITRLGITVANMDGGLYNFINEQGKIDFSQLMAISNIIDQKQKSISNTFINSTIGQFQQANDSKKTKQKIVKSSADTEIEFLKNPKLKSNFYKILEKWWWAFIIPLAVALIAIGIEKGWFN